MFLNWISALIKAAVIRGFKDAIEELDLEHDDSDALETIKGRINKLPAPRRKKDAAA